MDDSQHSGLPPDPADAVVSTRPASPVWGIVITVVILAFLIGLFTWVIIRSGGAESSYYNNLMERSQLRQEHGADR